MRFSVHGPFQIPRHNGLVARDAASRREFWEGIELAEEGLSEACGCYVFAVGKSAWYVGMASKRTFEGECFAPHKIMLYNEILHELCGKPTLTLIAPRTPEKRFRKPSKNGHGSIDFLEDILIGMGIRHNPELLNIRGTKLLKTMNVPGILNTGRGQGKRLAVRWLRKVLGA